MSTPFKLKKIKDFDFGNKGNFDLKNTGNFKNLEETGYGPADNIDFHKGEGSIGDPVTKEHKSTKKKSIAKIYSKPKGKRTEY